jgi:hypothetical protein
MKWATYLSLAILILGIIAGFSIYKYEAPEDCFVREMKLWVEKEDLSDEVTSLTQNDSEMAVARAKAIFDTQNYKDLNKESKRIYIQAETLFNYCDVKQ